MRKFIAIAVLSLLATLASAKDNYDLKITVLDTKNITSSHGSFSWGGGIYGGGGWAHRVQEHVFAQCSNGMDMELAPEKDKNMLLPGEYPARITRDVVIVGFPVKKGFKEIKMKVIEAHPTAGQPVAAPSTVPTPTAPATQSPEEAAKRAQQYADCLKVAVSNPSIVCKP
jgi:hypothetical protein